MSVKHWKHSKVLTQKPSWKVMRWAEIESHHTKWNHYRFSCLKPFPVPNNRESFRMWMISRLFPIPLYKIIEERNMPIELWFFVAWKHASWDRIPPCGRWKHLFSERIKRNTIVTPRILPSGNRFSFHSTTFSSTERILIYYPTLSSPFQIVNRSQKKIVVCLKNYFIFPWANLLIYRFTPVRFP